MLGPKKKKLLVRGMKLLFALVMGASLLGYGASRLGYSVFQPEEAVFLWTLPVALLILGGYFCVLPLEPPEPEPVNRWQRASHRAGWIFSELIGALFIGAAVAGIMWETLAQHSAVVGMVAGVLLIVGALLVLVFLLLIGGLGVIGFIAQGNEEKPGNGRARGVSGTARQEQGRHRKILPLCERLLSVCG